MKQLLEFFIKNHVSYSLRHLDKCWHLTITTSMLAKFYIEIASILTTEEALTDYIRALEGDSIITFEFSE